MQLEAERLVGVGACVLRVGGAAGRRARAVRGAAVALRLGGPRREHRGLDRHRLLLYTNQRHYFRYKYSETFAKNSFLYVLRVAV